MDLLRVDLDQSKYPGIISVYFDSESNFDEMRITSDGKLVHTYNKSNPVAFLRLNENSGDVQIYLIKDDLEYSSFLVPSAYAITSNPVEDENIHIMYSKSDSICKNVVCVPIEKYEKDWGLLLFLVGLFGAVMVSCILVYYHFIRKDIDILDEGYEWPRIIYNKSLETGGVTNGIL